MRHLLVAAVTLAACGTDPDVDGNTPIDFPYDEIPEDTQRPGDPAKGYDYLINGGYITCGLPKSIAPAANSADVMAGRTGDNAQLPYYWSAATSQEGVRVVSANCLMCHASKINGQLIVGLGAHDRDFTQDQASLVELAGNLIQDDTERAEWMRFRDRMRAVAPFSRTDTIGVNPADSLTGALMAHRDPTTLAWSNEPLIELPPTYVVPVDVPPWWRMTKKHAMFYNASGRGDHARIMMAASLLCTETVEEATAIDAAFTDVRAWLEEGIEAPKWPFGTVDMNLVARGEQVFEETCAKCHGTYGKDGVYPNQLVPLEDIKTDPTLVAGQGQFAAPFVEWFNNSFWGQTSTMQPQNGYIAPPLDGIWATAPYLHNGSVPTLAALLDSTTRPDFWTRSYTEYDPKTLGWKFTAMDHGKAAEPSPQVKIRLYDTTLVGYSNAGHTFGDALEAEDRTALLEYLKTL